MDLVISNVEVLDSPFPVDLKKVISFALLSRSCVDKGSSTNDSYANYLKPLTSKSLDSRNDSLKAIF